MRKGLPKKYAKHGFKKGWKLYKAAQKKHKTSGTAAKTRTVVKQRSTTLTGANKMPAKKKRVMRRATYKTGAPVRINRRRRAPKLLSPQTLNIVIDGALIGAGAIGSTVAVNMTPILKDQKTWIKSLGQAGAGILLMSFFKDKYIKKASMGLLVGAGISAILPFLPEGMKVFGGRRRFSPAELAKLQTLGRPYGLSNVGRPATLGRPVSVTTAQSEAPIMGRTSNRNSRYR